MIISTPSPCDPVQGHDFHVDRIAVGGGGESFVYFVTKLTYRFFWDEYLWDTFSRTAHFLHDAEPQECKAVCHMGDVGLFLGELQFQPCFEERIELLFHGGCLGFCAVA